MQSHHPGQAAEAARVRQLGDDLLPHFRPGAFPGAPADDKMRAGRAADAPGGPASADPHQVDCGRGVGRPAGAVARPARIDAARAPSEMRRMVRRPFSRDTVLPRLGPGQRVAATVCDDFHDRGVRLPASTAVANGYADRLTSAAAASSTAARS